MHTHEVFNVDELTNCTLTICEQEMAMAQEPLQVAEAFVRGETPADFSEEQRLMLLRCLDADAVELNNTKKDSENYWRLLVTTAADVRVIMILIARQLAMTQMLTQETDEKLKNTIAYDAGKIYAPIAHKLGLYKVKSMLEDLAMKSTEPEAYYHIKEKLSATKEARDTYIQQFITPLEKRLQEAGLHFYIKGRTKSIHSIWQKMKKQQCSFEGVYDLFAIRIILQSPEEHTTSKPSAQLLQKEKIDCWQAYSIVTDMYVPNTRRLRDWISMPKSNGYESLHITVKAPDDKWVEVQIRTQRMDDIAERGVAAHWRYKGIAQAETIDSWFNAARMSDNDALITPSPEVYVITPKGDIWNFPNGATVLDFAYRIHTNVGNHCTGARINQKLVPVKQQLANGQHIDIITSNTQQPKHDWLNIVVTPRAKAKIRQTLKAMQVHNSQVAKEMLERRLKNRKIAIEEHTMAQVVKHLGFKETTEFYRHIVEGKLNVLDVIKLYTELQNDNDANDTTNTQHADTYQLEDAPVKTASDELVIGRGVKGIDYTLAKCCTPIYGDDIFGFLTSGGGVKIHRNTCPNAQEMKRRYPYRIIKAHWGESNNNDFNVTLRIVGKDNIAVVNTISQVIMHDPHHSLRAINIDSNDGLFKGTLTVITDDISRLPALMRKLKTVNGVTSVDRT